MQFDGAALAVILREQESPVQICDLSGMYVKSVSGAEAADIVRSDYRYVGVGHSKRIRCIQPMTGGRIGGVAWRGGSHTTKRIPILNEQGEKITGLLITEHKGLAFSRPQG
jgi:hypothetical protein